MALNVLLLETNPVARDFLSRVVQDSFSDAVHVDAVGSVEAAQQAVQAASTMADANFRMILVDLELHDGAGLAWLASLAQHPAVKIATTLHSDDEHLFPALCNGADGYLLKEDRFEVLVEELQKIVRGHPPLSPSIARRLLTHFAPHGDTALTSEERDMLSYLSKGFTCKEIANQTGLKWFVVNENIKRVYKKLHAVASAGDGDHPAQRALN